MKNKALGHNVKRVEQLVNKLMADLCAMPVSKEEFLVLLSDAESFLENAIDAQRAATVSDIHREAKG